MVVVWYEHSFHGSGHRVWDPLSGGSVRLLLVPEFNLDKISLLGRTECHYQCVPPCFSNPASIFELDMMDKGFETLQLACIPGRGVSCPEKQRQVLACG